MLLSYEYEATTAQKKGEELDYVIPDDTIKIDIDIATTEDADPAAQKFLDYVLSEPGQERFADWGYRPVNEAVLDAEQVEVPGARRPVHDRRPRRLAEGQRRAVRPREGLDRQDRGGGRGVDGLSERRAPASRAGAPRAGLAERGRWRWASSTLWLSLIVLLPLAAVVAHSLDGGLDEFWDAVTSRQAVAALRFTLLVSLGDGRDQRGLRAR